MSHFNGNFTLFYHLAHFNCWNGPCKNGAICEPAYKGVECICKDNWKGWFCESKFELVASKYPDLAEHIPYVRQDLHKFPTSRIWINFNAYNSFDCVAIVHGHCCILLVKVPVVDLLAGVLWIDDLPLEHHFAKTMKWRFHGDYSF